MHGQGTYFFKDGSQWTGRFVQDKQEGQGVNISEDGIQENVTYKEGIQ